MNLKSLLLLSSLMFGSVQVYAQSTQDADWVVETSTLLLSGVAAQDLFNSLNAPVKLDPLSTKYDQVQIKKNVFAKCSARFLRLDSDEDGDIEWTFESATCQIKAPKNTTINQ